MKRIEILIPVADSEGNLVDVLGSSFRDQVQQLSIDDTTYVYPNVTTWSGDGAVIPRVYMWIVQDADVANVLGNLDAFLSGFSLSSPVRFLSYDITVSDVTLTGGQVNANRRTKQSR